MRKAWSKIFLLCMACMICMSGLCLAKDGNWIKYHNHDSSKYYVNPSSLKAREYEGRKYLEANVDISGTQMLLALDIENGKYIVLEGHNHVTGKTTKTDISQMSQQSPTFSGIPIYDKLIRWVEKNRPDVINEIRTHNLTAPPLPSAPRGKTDVSGPRSNTPIDPAPGVDRQPGTEDQPGGNVDVTGMEPPVPSTHGGTLANISGDIPYEVLDSGAVKFTLRRGEPIDSVSETYYLFAKPEEMKAWPGAYALGVIYNDKVNNINILSIELFDYDSSTNTIQWYSTVSANHGLVADPEKTVYNDRMRVMDKNTVYIEQADFGGALVAEGPFKIMIDSYFGKKYPVQFTIKYSSCADPNQRDVNGCQWSYTDYGGERVFGYDNRKLEAAILCCSLKGNLGEIPLGEDFEFFQLDNKYRFSR